MNVALAAPTSAPSAAGVLHTSITIAKAYALAQLTTGVQLGVALAFGMMMFGWSLLALAVLIPMGFPLMLLQYALALRWLGKEPTDG